MYHTILGCSTDIDKWGIEWPSTVAGNTATYNCSMSTGAYIRTTILLLILSTQVIMMSGICLR